MTALSFVNDATLLTVEESPTGAHLYSLDLGGATSVLGGAYDSPAGAALDDLDAEGLARAGIVPVSKSLLFDVGRVAGPGSRIEGLAVLAADTVSFSTDDGFGVPPASPRFGFEDPAEPPAPAPASRVFTVRLNSALPLGR
jgi:hypothetical protein